MRRLNIPSHSLVFMMRFIFFLISYTNFGAIGAFPEFEWSLAGQIFHQLTWCRIWWGGGEEGRGRCGQSISMVMLLREGGQAVRWGGSPVVSENQT